MLPALFGVYFRLNSRPDLAPAAGQQVKPSPKMLFLQNELFKIGVDEAAGGGIAYFSNAQDGRNVLNAYDLGRYIQQSYYGRDDNSNWNGNPWKWNPVQCGRFQQQPSLPFAKHLVDSMQHQSHQSL